MKPFSFLCLYLTSERNWQYAFYLILWKSKTRVLEAPHIEFSNAFLITKFNYLFLNPQPIWWLCYSLSLLKTLSTFGSHDPFDPTSMTDSFQGSFPPFSFSLLAWFCSNFLLLISILHKVDWWYLTMGHPLWGMAILEINPLTKATKKVRQNNLKICFREISECQCWLNARNVREQKSREVHLTFRPLLLSQNVTSRRG